MSEAKHRQAGSEGAREMWRGLPGLLQTPGREGARRGGTPMGRRLPELPRGRAGFITVHGAGKLRVHRASGGTLRSLMPCQGDRRSQTDYSCPGPAWQSRRAEFIGPHCPGYLAAPRTKLQVFKEMPEVRPQPCEQGKRKQGRDPAWRENRSNQQGQTQNQHHETGARTVVNGLHVTTVGDSRSTLRRDVGSVTNTPANSER